MVVQWPWSIWVGRVFDGHGLGAGSIKVYRGAGRSPTLSMNSEKV